MIICYRSLETYHLCVKIVASGCTLQGVKYINADEMSQLIYFPPRLKFYDHHLEINFISRPNHEIILIDYLEYPEY